MPPCAYAWSNRSPRDRSRLCCTQRDDSRAILTVSGGADRIVVAADAFTAQLLFPLYYRKIICLADAPDLERLGTALDGQRIAGALLVSRLEHPIGSCRLFGSADRNDTGGC